ncbi:MAG: TPM domain-containing protein, partial [Acidobacteriales bacterium]
ANALFRKWGIGKKGTDEGVLLLLVTRDRRMRLEVGYGLEPVLPDGLSGSILRQMRPALKESRYGEALAEALNVLGTRIAEAKGVSIDAPLPRSSRPATRSLPPWPQMIFGLILMAWVLGALGKGGGRGMGGPGGNLLAGMILGNVLGRSFGSGRGGGGFGGFDSGGGFGGFGGGDSGGGGASGSW